MLKLLDAINRYKKERKAISNAYGWYRKQAKESGCIEISGVKISAKKINNNWFVNSKSFDKAILAHRKELQKIKTNTLNYQKGILRKTTGEVKTEWGGYKVKKGFRLETNDTDIIRKKSNGTWYCNKCNTPAITLHEKAECHTCSDWGGCGEDCTLSGIKCPQCGASRDL
jgi:hypothetical protein